MGAMMWQNAYDTPLQSAFVVKQKVRTMRLDDLLYGEPVFLLKIDTEGWDAKVLRGASDYFSRKLIRFVIFEYHRKWRVAGHSLKNASATLYGYGYLCFLITADALVPVYDRWWQRMYEDYTWKNVFCGQSGDASLFDVYISYGTQRATLQFALENLVAQPEERPH